MPPRVCHVILTRCMEKPALLTLQLVNSLIVELFGGASSRKEVQGFVFMSDNGSHFASYRYLDYKLLQVPDENRVHTQTIYGVQYQMKSC